MSNRLFRRYDADTKRAIFCAASLAAHRQQESITPEDLLLGVSWKTHDPNCEFQALKADAGSFWAALGVAHLPQTALHYDPAHLPMSDGAERVLAYMTEEADADREYWIEIDHLLRGILREGCPASQVLRDHGWTDVRIKEMALRNQAQFPRNQAPLLPRLMRTIGLR